MRYAKSVLFTLIVRGIGLPIGLLSSVITARALGPSGRGALAILIVLQGLAVQFGTFGFNASITYFIARNQDLTGVIVSNAQIVAVVGGSLIALLYFFLSNVAPSLLLGAVDPSYLMIFLISFPFVLLSQSFQNVLLAKQRIVEFNLLDLLSRILQLAAFALFLLVLSGGTTEAVWCLTGVSVISGVFYYAGILRIGPISVSFDWSLFLEMFRYGIRTYFASFVMFLLLRSNLPLINYLLGEKESGIYSVTLQMMDLVYLLPVTMGMILFPSVSSNRADTGFLTARVFRFALMMMTIVCLFLAVFGSMIIKALFGEEFTGAIEPLYWLTPGIVFLSLVTILNNDLAGRGLPSIVIISPALAFLLNLLLHLVFLPLYGIVASSIASSISFMMVLVMLIASFCGRTGITFRQLLTFRLREFALTDVLQK